MAISSTQEQAFRQILSSWCRNNRLRVFPRHNLLDSVLFERFFQICWPLWPEGGRFTQSIESYLASVVTENGVDAPSRFSVEQSSLKEEWQRGINAYFSLKSLLLERMLLSDCYALKGTSFGRNGSTKLSFIVQDSADPDRFIFVEEYRYVGITYWTDQLERFSGTQLRACFRQLRDNANNCSKMPIGLFPYGKFSNLIKNCIPEGFPCVVLGIENLVEGWYTEFKDRWKVAREHQEQVNQELIDARSRMQHSNLACEILRRFASEERPLVDDNTHLGMKISCQVRELIEGDLEIYRSDSNGLILERSPTYVQIPDLDLYVVIHKVRSNRVEWRVEFPEDIPSYVVSDLANRRKERGMRMGERSK